MPKVPWANWIHHRSVTSASAVWKLPVKPHLTQLGARPRPTGTPGMLEHGSLRTVCPFIRGWFRGQAGKELGNFKTQTIMSDFSRKTWSCRTDCLTEIVTIQKAPWKPSQGAWCNDPLALILSVSPSSFPHPQDGLCIWAPLKHSFPKFLRASPPSPRLYQSHPAAHPMYRTLPFEFSFNYCDKNTLTKSSLWDKELYLAYIFQVIVH